MKDENEVESTEIHIYPSVLLKFNKIYNNQILKELKIGRGGGKIKNISLNLA